MSGFIPMISDSPPPFDNDGGFDDWDDDDEEFGNFTAASNISVLSSTEKNSNTAAVDSNASAFQMGSHLTSDSGASFANFDKFDGIANIVNAENDNNLNIVHEEIPERPKLKRLSLSEENVISSSNGSDVDVLDRKERGSGCDACKSSNSPEEAHCSGEFSQHSVSDSGIICSNDISPVPHSDNMTSDICDKSNSLDIDDSLCDSQIISKQSASCLSNHDGGSCAVGENDNSGLKNDLSKAGEIKIEDDKSYGSQNNLVSEEVISSADDPVDNKSTVNNSEHFCNLQSDSENPQHSSYEKLTSLSPPDEEMTFTGETAGSSNSNLSQEDDIDSVVLNNCSNNDDSDNEEQNTHEKSVSISISEDQNAEHSNSHKNEHTSTKNEDISNNLSSVTKVADGESVGYNIVSSHSQNAIELSNVCDNYSDSGESSAQQDLVKTSQNITDNRSESVEHESISEGHHQYNLNQTEECTSGKCSNELTAFDFQDGDTDTFSDFSSALPLEQSKEDQHRVSEESSDVSSKLQGENMEDYTAHNIPSNTETNDTDGGGPSTLSSHVDDTQGFDLDSQSDDNWASFSGPTTEPAESTPTFQAFPSDSSDDVKDGDDNWADFKSTSQLSSDTAFKESEDSEEFSAFETPSTEGFSYQTLKFQEGLEKYIGVVDRCFAAQTFNRAFASMTVNSLLILLDSSKESDNSSEESASDNCDTRGSRVWKCLKKEDKGDALTYQWMDSSGNRKFFKTINVDTQNMLFGHKKSSVPIFASGLGMLEPMKGPLEAQRNGGRLTSVNASKEICEQPGDNNVSTVQFDWMGSGLVNPLEGNGGRLDLDFLAINEASSSGKSTVFDSEFLKKSELELKVGPQLEELLTNIKPTCIEPTKSEGNLSGEGNKIITSLPDLSFMKAKVLMFPMLKNKKY